MRTFLTTYSPSLGQPSQFRRTWAVPLSGSTSSKEELDKHSYLRGRYTVFPIISDGGPSTLLRTGQAGKYNEMPCVGGYVDGGIEKLGDGNRSILAGKDQKYGYRRIAVIQTSDNRSADHALLGKYRTWIKG
jgi:hypothetical protein